MLANPINWLTTLLRFLVCAYAFIVTATAWAISPEIIEQAKREGEAVLYTTMPVASSRFSTKPRKKNIHF